MPDPILPDPHAEWTAPLAALRAAGWSVAVHNDYVLDGRLRTFWLLTRKGGTCAKGEGLDDAAALRACPGAEEAAAGADPAAVSALARLRAAGWQVAIHNDFRLAGRARTFWRIVNPAAGTYRDGEGDTDAEALAACLAEAGLGPPSR